MCMCMWATSVEMPEMAEMHIPINFELLYWHVLRLKATVHIVHNLFAMLQSETDSPITSTAPKPKICDLLYLGR
jgi:hypothetical protein